MEVVADHKIDWESWRDITQDSRNVNIPRKISFMIGDERRNASCQLQDATLDELSSAIVLVKQRIRELLEVRSGLEEVNRRVRSRVTNGSTRVWEALGLVDGLLLDDDDNLPF
jgi:hypothetical protein